MAEISVIVTYYNEPLEAVTECVQSILRQTYTDFEIILIDDGSLEENARLLETLKALDERIKVVHQRNQGVSVARNNAVSLSSGRYIAFVDSDDVVLPYYLEEAHRVTLDKDADIVYGMNYRTNDRHYQPERIGHPGVSFAEEEWLKKYLVGYVLKEGNKSFGRGPVSRLVRSEIARSTPFIPGIPIGEDVIWNLEILQKAKKRYVVDQIWYLYYYNTESVTAKYNPDILKSILPFYTRIGLHFPSGDRHRDLYYQRLFNDLKQYVFRAYLGNRMNQNAFLARWREFNLICKDDPWRQICEPEAMRIANNKDRVKLWLFKWRLLFPLWSVQKPASSTNRGKR